MIRHRLNKVELIRACSIIVLEPKFILYILRLKFLILIVPILINKNFLSTVFCIWNSYLLLIWECVALDVHFIVPKLRTVIHLIDLVRIPVNRGIYDVNEIRHRIIYSNILRNSYLKLHRIEYERINCIRDVNILLIGYLEILINACLNGS